MTFANGSNMEALHIKTVFVEFPYSNRVPDVNWIFDAYPVKVCVTTMDS